MCKETETTSSVNKGDKASVEQLQNEQQQEAGSSNKTNKSDDKASSSRPENFPWWRGGGKIPYSGAELGVLEKSLEDRANCLELWWMSYLNPLLSLGSRKVLDHGDVGVPSDQDLADRVYTGAKNAWDERVETCRIHNEPLIQKRKEREAALKEQEELGIVAASPDKKKKKGGPKPIVLKEPSITMALVSSFGMGRFVLAVFYQILSSLLGFIPVLILNDLVKYFESFAYQNSAEAGNDDGIDYKPFVNPWIQVVGLGVVPLLVSLLQTRHNAIMTHCGVYVRTAVSTMLYRKALTVSAAGRAMTSTGQVVNMMSNDTMQLQRFLQFAGFTAIAPIQIIISLALIYEQVGNATWVGVAYMFLLMPINMWVFSVVGKMRRKVLMHSDSRVKMMNEILTGIRIIKFYAWERPFGKEVARVRGKEMDALTKMSYVVAVGFSIILLSTPIIQPIFVFLTYVNIQDQPLTAATAFTTVALFNLMRFPFAFMPMGLLQFIQSRISLKRLERYLALPELNPYVIAEGPDSGALDPEAKAILSVATSMSTSTAITGGSDGGADAGIEIDGADTSKSGSITILDGSFGWVNPDGPVIKPIQEEQRSKKKEKAERAQKRASRRASRKSDATLNTDAADGSVDVDQVSLESMSASSVTTTESGAETTPVITLRNITTHIRPGSLVAVVGSVGSGKSSLLSAILGEMESIGDSKVYAPRSEDEKEMDGFVSYCTQSPWVVNDTLQGNILFGRPHDEARYQEILAACALLDDIAVLPAGDQTEIGMFALCLALRCEYY